MPRAGVKPLGLGEFARRLDRLGPFERRPQIAVAVSGGPDSLALVLLADRWARARGGRAIALIVDHRLRSESAAEARQVTGWLRAHRIAGRTLVWRGRKPERGLQAAAREARYALLAAHCRRQGLLHLLLAHHADDQLETFLMRLGHGSGLDGLAAMPAIAETDGVRLLRPLLEVGKARLLATLRALGQGWVEDPSNANPRFERVRLRRARPAIERAGLGAKPALAAVRALGRARARNAARIDDLLAMAAMTPDRFVRLPGDWLAQAPRPLGLRALARLLLAVGGTTYGPRGERLERCYDWLRGGTGRARTLGGCLLLRQRNRLYLLPEAAGSASEGRAKGWRPLGAAGWRSLVAAHPALAREAPPAEFRERAMAFWRGGQPVTVPALGLPAAAGSDPKRVIRPGAPLIPARFAVA